MVNDNSLVYFDSLYQPWEVPSENDRMDNLLFVKYPYEIEKQTITYEWILSWEQSVNDEKPSKYFLKTEYTKGLWITVDIHHNCSRIIFNLYHLQISLKQILH